VDRRQAGGRAPRAAPQRYRAQGPGQPSPAGPLHPELTFKDMVEETIARRRSAAAVSAASDANEGEGPDSGEGTEAKRARANETAKDESILVRLSTTDPMAARREEAAALEAAGGMALAAPESEPLYVSPALRRELEALVPCPMKRSRDVRQLRDMATSYAQAVRKEASQRGVEGEKVRVSRASMRVRHPHLSFSPSLTGGGRGSHAS